MTLVFWGVKRITVKIYLEVEEFFHQVGDANLCWMDRWGHVEKTGDLKSFEMSTMENVLRSQLDINKKISKQ